MWDEAARQAILARSEVLDRLIVPPTVVVVGRPNVGKSTLTNAMLGRAVSVVADLPGTTRDWVGGVAELSCKLQVSSSESSAQAESREPETGNLQPETSIAVQWFDTPGLRLDSERIERRAIELAQQVVQGADVLIAMRDPVTDWPAPADLPRTPDLWVMNKMDTATGVEAGEKAATGESAETPLRISAEHHRGLDRLARWVLAVLQLETLRREECWAFTTTLREAVRGGDVAA